VNETVKLILSLSLSGSILAVVIFALKPFIKHRLAKSMQYYIWLVVLLRLVLPFSFEGSIMDNLFYGEQTAKEINSPSTVMSMNGTNKSVNESRNSSSILQDVQENVADSVYNADHSRYFRGLFNQYALYLWLIGVIIALIANLTGYLRFAKYIKQANKPAAYEETQLLASLAKGRKVRLARNHFISTPLLIGILKPCIIIPDISFNENQLRNILLHEISHLRRFDIGIKWLTMIATSIHWFNPIIYFIKKEINHACELACDEEVIKDFNSSEKQAYGDTLISVVAEHKYPLGVLQATMCEEKRSLKERLIAIMNHNKKSRFIIIFSVVLLGAIIFGAVYLGAVSFGNKISYKEVPLEQIVPNGEIEKIASQNDSGNPSCGVKVSGFKNFATIIPSKGQKVKIISVEKSQNVGIDIVYDIVNLSDNNALPEGIAIEFKNLFGSPVGFVQKPGQMAYNLAEIAKYKTPYLGDNSKVSAIVGQLPEPDNYFKQQYISMITDGTNKLNVFYEAKEGASHSNEWPVANPENPIYSNMRKNALVLFCMIDNLNEVTFAFRDSQSYGKLDTSKYDTAFNFSRTSLQEHFGNLSVIGGNLEKLQDALIGIIIYAEPEFTNQEVAAARSVVEEYFRAVKAKDSKAILKTLTPQHNNPNVVLFGEETRTLLLIDYNPEDPMRQSYITSGRGGVNGTKKENVIVFKVNFNVEYPKGVTGPFNEGKYKNWSVILIRDGKNSPWLIDDQGY
jgi:beta-lactamase regulating signal transducer with metallopeptidase domain